MVGYRTTPRKAAQELPLARRAARRPIVPERTVVDIARSARRTDADGYAVTTSGRAPGCAATGASTRRAASSCRRRARHEQAARRALRGSLPRVSDRLASRADQLRGDPRRHAAARRADMTKRVAISSSVYPDPDTTSRRSPTATRATPERALHAAGRRRDAADAAAQAARRVLRHPSPGSRAGRRGWSRRTIIVLVMQSLDNAIALRARRRPRAACGSPPSRIPSGRTRRSSRSPTSSRVARRAHRRDRQSSIMEAVANIPTTAHILGGAVIGADRPPAWWTVASRVFGYEQPPRMRRGPRSRRTWA